MEAIWKTIATVQEKMMRFYESIHGTLNQLTTLRYDVERNNRTLKELRTICVEMSESEERPERENNLVAFG